MMIIKTAKFITSSPFLEKCPATTLPEFAFIGRSNVGKSSLINMLTNQKNLAKTSSTPGKTQLINHFLINENWYLVDLPGYGYAKISKKNRKKFETSTKNYLIKRENLVCLFILIDIRHQPLKNDVEFIRWTGINKIPFALVFTKSDKISSSILNKNMKKYGQVLLKEWEKLPPTFVTSSVTGYGRNEILDFIEHVTRDFDDSSF